SPPRRPHLGPPRGKPPRRHQAEGRAAPPSHRSPLARLLACTGRAFEPAEPLRQAASRPIGRGRNTRPGYGPPRNPGARHFLPTPSPPPPRRSVSPAEYWQSVATPRRVLQSKVLTAGSRARGRPPQTPPGPKRWTPRAHAPCLALATLDQEKGRQSSIESWDQGLGTGDQGLVPSAKSPVPALESPPHQ